MCKLAGVIACCSLAIACSHPSAKPEAPPKALAPEPGGPDIVIGAYLPMTGAEAASGIALGNGITLAVAEQNHRGGIRGRRIVLRTADTTGKTSEVAAAVTRLASNEGALAILGDIGSRRSRAGAVVAQQLGVPMILPAATSPPDTEVGDMISRACILDEAQAFAMASFARNSLKLARVAVLYDQSLVDSAGLVGGFSKAFEKLGGTIETMQGFNGSYPDFQRPLAAIRDAKVDAIFAPVSAKAAGVLAGKLRELGVTAPMLGASGWDSPELVHLAGAAIEGSYYTNHFAVDDPRPIVKELVQRYRSRFGGDPDGLAALGYDSARLLFAAMLRAPSLSGKDLAAAIASTSRFHGATGSLTMGPDRNPKKSIAMLQIKAGKPVLVEQLLPP